MTSTYTEGTFVDHPPTDMLAKRQLIQHEAIAGIDYYLTRVPEGFEIAGSSCRYTLGYYSVRFMLGNAWHGRKFTNQGAASAWFQVVTEAARQRLTL